MRRWTWICETWWEAVVIPENIEVIQIYTNGWERGIEQRASRRCPSNTKRCYLRMSSYLKSMPPAEKERNQAMCISTTFLTRSMVIHKNVESSQSCAAFVASEAFARSGAARFFVDVKIEVNRRKDTVDGSFVRLEGASDWLSADLDLSMSTVCLSNPKHRSPR
jgi:hypothetical protein